MNATLTNAHRSAAASNQRASRGCVALVANTSWYLFNFRRGLIQDLLADGFDVVAIAPHDQYVDDLIELGARWIDWPLQRAGKNPIAEGAAIRSLYRIYRAEEPLLTHHFTIKAILYGSIASRMSGVRRVVNSVTGLGHVFVSKSTTARIIRPFVRWWYTNVLAADGVRPMFQNKDDLRLLAAGSSRIHKRAVFTAGSGVDLSRFPRTRASEHNATSTTSRRVLFVGRLLKEKGICEFVEAADRCALSHDEIEFAICGEPDLGNPSSIDDETLASWNERPHLSLLGHVYPIDEQLTSADLVVLPSYREGTPRVLLEAGAAGKAVVATDVPGCRDVVQHGRTGLLVPPRDVNALANAMSELLDDNEQRTNMGHAGRQLIAENFDERTVVRDIRGAYASLMNERPLNGHEVASVALPRGVFTFSLDFELAWGTRGRPRAKDAPPWLDGTRTAIRNLLDQFETFDIPATWATVGALWMPSRGGRKHEWLRDARYEDVPMGDCRSEPHWYAEDVLEWLTDCRTQQELGCHTLTHIFVEPGREGRAELKSELARFCELFSDLNLPTPRSFIFPKAKMAHIKLLNQMGYSSYRGPENKWFESLPGEVPSAACRLLDAKAGIAPRVLRPTAEVRQLWRIPSSQFYSPFMSVGKHVSVGARVRKAIKGLRRAAETKGVYHLWTHPFNLGLRTDELLAGIRQVLTEANRLRDAGDLDVLPMGDIAARLNTVRESHAPSKGDDE